MRATSRAPRAASRSPATLALAYRANLESRLASRILWRVGGGPYRDERDLYALAQALDWHRLFEPRRTLRVDVTATRSPLEEPGIRDAAHQGCGLRPLSRERGMRPSIDKRAPDVRVSAYLTEHDATLYVDTSGEPLFKRGYRRDAEEAPLRENLAAGLLALAGWTPGVPLLDPMCGSGTIAVEAALIAADRAPGLARTFGFQKLAWYDGPAWQRMKQAARDRIRPAPAAPAIFASDIAQAAVAKCAGAISPPRRCATSSSSSVPTCSSAPRLRRRACCVANPPYGERLDDAQRARRVLSEARRCAEAALRRLDRVPPDRRPAPRRSSSASRPPSERRCTTARSNAGCSRSRSVAGSMR